MNVCSDKKIFNEIGPRAQESLVNAIFEESCNNVKILKIIESFIKEDILAERYVNSLRSIILSLDVREVLASELSLSTCFESIIKALKSYNWYIQNPIVSYVMRKNDEIKNLKEEEQIELGRNIYQSAEGGANSSIEYIRKIKDKEILSSLSIIYGMILEAFINERNVIRLKYRFLSDVLSIIDSLSEDDKKYMINKLCNVIEEGDVLDKDRINDDLRNVYTLQPQYPWIEQALDKISIKSVPF